MCGGVMERFGQMRVIAGVARGRVLRVSGTARPYLEKTRGAIFNSLCALVPGARVLDLYAGSGSVGIEALSRGAESCVFVEAERSSADTITHNLAATGLAGVAQVVCARAEGFCSAAGREYDLVFVDPPFADIPGWEASPQNLRLMQDLSRLLAGEGRLVFRFEQGRMEAPRWPGLELEKDRQYGRSRVLYYRRGE